LIGGCFADECVGARVAHEQAAVVAQPDIAIAVLQHAEIAGRRRGAGIDPSNGAAGQIQMVEPALGGDPHAADVIAADRVDLVI
jgi:hypothetical protein